MFVWRRKGKRGNKSKSKNTQIDRSGRGEWMQKCFNFLLLIVDLVQRACASSSTVAFGKTDLNETHVPRVGCACAGKKRLHSKFGDRKPLHRVGLRGLGGKEQVRILLCCQSKSIDRSMSNDAAWFDVWHFPGTQSIESIALQPWLGTHQSILRLKRPAHAWLLRQTGLTSTCSMERTSSLGGLDTTKAPGGGGPIGTSLDPTN